MSISLLYRDETAFNMVGTIGEDALDQLSLRHLTDRLGLSRRDAEYFLRILAKPLTREADIVYRHEVLQAFMQQPHLLNELIPHFDRLYQLRADYNDLKREKRQLLRSASQEGIPDASKNLLQAAGLSLKRCLLLLEAITRTLGAHSTEAEGLTVLLSELQKITADQAFCEMCALCSRFEMYTEVTGTAIRLKLKDSGMLTGYDLADRQRVAFHKPEAKKRFFFAKKEDSENTPAAPINLYYCQLQTELRSNAMLSLSELVDSLTGQLFDRFLQIGRELTFYQCAMKYIAMLQGKGAPICFAQVSRCEQLRFCELFDPLLVQSCEKLTEVVPNDLDPSVTPGLALFGENGSGKTVWLRSAGLLQIFSQAGLPIPARFAEIRLYNRIFTHFSSAETEFEADNEAGRFEQEVRKMASILDEIGDRGLILLNETFQTTSYEEGAEELSHILRYFAESGNHWMLTTHLTDLPRFFREGELSILRTDDSYRVLPIS